MAGTTRRATRTGIAFTNLSIGTSKVSSKTRVNRRHYNARQVRSQFMELKRGKLIKKELSHRKWGRREKWGRSPISPFLNYQNGEIGERPHFLQTVNGSLSVSFRCTRVTCPLFQLPETPIPRV